MNKTILSQESLAFVNSLDLKKPLSNYPKWFQSTKTIKENDAVICALVQHFHLEIEAEVKCTVNSTIVHKWEIVVGRDEKDRMGDLRRSYTDQQVRTAFTIFSARREAEQKARTKKRQREARSGVQVPQRMKQASTAIDARSKGKQREQVQTAISEEPTSVYRDLPFADSEHAELITAVQQIQSQELREMTTRHSTEMEDLLTNHRKQIAALITRDLHAGPSTTGRPSKILPSPPPSSPFNYGSSPGAGPSTISKQESILALTDLTVIAKMPPPKKRKADEEQDTPAKRHRAGDVDSKAYEIIDLLSDEE
ncbi:hypothetical protein VKT23_019207 [Stygiomarasmius scandens]|uniref:Uncharacterized protein n=1 Tax=Marasmiellus scandens TaxID=2682957 RepID=A0ABR1IM51_9AGAR